MSVAPLRQSSCSGQWQMSLRCVNPLRKAGEKTQEEDGTEQNKEVAGMNPAQPGEHKNKQKSTANTEVISQKSCRPDWDFYVKLEWKLRLFLCLAMAPVQSLPLPETWKKPLPPPHKLPSPETLPKGTHAPLLSMEKSCALAMFWDTHKTVRET